MNHHPIIADAMELLERSVQMAEMAVSRVEIGATMQEVREANVVNQSARVLQGAARSMVSFRSQAPRLAAANAKLIEGSGGGANASSARKQIGAEKQSDGGADKAPRQSSAA